MEPSGGREGGRRLVIVVFIVIIANTIIDFNIEGIEATAAKRVKIKVSRASYFINN